MSRRPPVDLRDLESGAEGREVVPQSTGAIHAMTAAEIDMQITTAKAYPRSIEKFMRNAQNLVQMNEDIAGGCIYALPRGGKNIEGPSARFAEIVANAWGNCRAAARPVGEDHDFVTVQGVFTDLENNVTIGFEVKRRITDKNGNRFNADMIAVTANAAGSIALRNAILKGIPKVYWEGAYRAARAVIVGDSTTLANKRAKALELMQKFGATPEQVFEKLGIKGEAEIMEDQLVVLRGIATTLRDGESTVEEIFGHAQTGKAAPAPTAGPAPAQAAPLAGAGDHAGSAAGPAPQTTAAPARELTPYEKLEKRLIEAKDAEQIGLVLDEARLGAPGNEATNTPKGGPLPKADVSKLERVAKLRIKELTGAKTGNEGKEDAKPAAPVLE